MFCVEFLSLLKIILFKSGQEQESEFECFMQPVIHQIPPIANLS